MSKQRHKRPLKCVAALIAFCASSATACSGEREPTEWSGKGRFCAQAALLGVGEPELSRDEHAQVLRQLVKNGPTTLTDELTAIHDDPRQVDKDTVDAVGRFIEQRCDVNLPGVTAE